MPRTCTVCRHPKRSDIDQALVASQPLRTIAVRWSVSKTALIRHRQDHIPASLAKARQASEVAKADTLLGDVEAVRSRSERLYEAAEEILHRALTTQDLKVALLAIKSAVDVMAEARNYLELKGKVTGELVKAEAEAKATVSSVRVGRAIIMVPPQLPPGDMTPMEIVAPGGKNVQIPPRGVPLPPPGAQPDPSSESEPGR